MEKDTDPENNFYKNNNCNCEYYTNEKLQSSVSMNNALSLIHFNSRSLCTNFQDIKECVNQFQKFNIIAISETWLTKEREQEVKIEGYELFVSNRTNKKGGGAALYVSNEFDCQLVNEMSTTIDNVMECVTIEMSI